MSVEIDMLSVSGNMEIPASSTGPGSSPISSTSSPLIPTGSLSTNSSAAAAFVTAGFANTYLGKK